MKISAKEWAIHLTGIVLFLMLPIVFSPDFMRTNSLFRIAPFVEDFVTYILLIAIFYLFYLYLFPKYYFSGKYLIFSIWLLLCFLIVVKLPGTLVMNLSSLTGFEFSHPMPDHMPMPKPQGHEFKMDRKPPFISRHIFQFAIVITFALLLRIYRRWKQAEKDKLTTELSYLKAQINPHFLFNSLNSIYSLALTKSNKAPDAVVKLSGLMRYVITDAGNDFVAVEKELNYISDYIELQKLRLGNTVTLKFEITNDHSGKSIAPLLLIPFIENAFKHGVNPEEDSSININIQINQQKLFLHTQNNLVVPENSNEEKSGIGLENAEKRLALLYPGRYQLNIQKTDQLFTVDLSIDLR
jgi:hypothetical protein